MTVNGSVLEACSRIEEEDDVLWRSDAAGWDVNADTSVDNDNSPRVVAVDSPFIVLLIGEYCACC